jgi:protein-S-isoprenylcysteine O-methyltransferase Ste14
MSIEVKIVVLIAASAAFALLTRRSLQSFRSHGLYRFLAFVAISVLVLLNLEYWFNEPFTLRQIVSWLLLLISIAAVAYGVISLRRGRPDSRREDATLLGMEKTTELVTTGAYRYVRHPMYSSILFGVLGIFLKHVSWQSALMTGITVSLVVVTARMEETENMRYFGNAYRSYMKQTRMFIPFLL